MKNKVVKKMLAYLLMSVIMATTAVGHVAVSPVSVLAEECFWSAAAQETNEVTFGDAEDWGTWENTLRATFTGNSKSIPVNSTLTFDISMTEEELNTLGDSDHIKLQAVFFQADNDWGTAKKLGWPEKYKADFSQAGDNSYKASVSMNFGEAVDVFHSLLIQGVGTGFTGKLTISNIKIEVPQEEQPLEPTEPTVVASFDENITGWAGESGWDYSHGKADPEKNDTTPIEKAEAAWDEASKSLKMSLDYSKDTASGWSEAKVSGTFNPVNVSNYNIVTFQLKYPSTMDSIKTKLFMQSTDGVKLMDAEGSFRTKTVTDLGDGWSTVTIRGEFQPKDKEVTGITIGIVGPYADLKTVYIDDVTFGQLDASEDYVEITEQLQATGDEVDLSSMATSVKLVDSHATAETKALAAYLKGLQTQDKVLFGHQNSTFRSVRDNGVTSDVKDVTGSEAGLFGIDTLALAGSECSADRPLEASIEASKKAYEGGSLITLSCHMPNFANSKITATTDPAHPYDFSKCDFNESKDLTPCADYILEGGKYNAQYNAYLDIIAEYALALQDEDVPILFRPFHENSGGWFWWGTSTSVDSYRAIWRYMVNYLESKDVHNLLYVYSPNGPIEREEDYLSRFPGDAYVDVLAFDFYDDYADVNEYTGDIFFENLAKSCDVVAKLAADRNKIPAIAETGIRITGAGKDSLMVNGNPTKGKDWYNQVVNTAAAHDIPYFLLWANFDNANFFIPYKFNDTMGQEMINDFISAYNNDKSIFGNGTNFYGASGAVSKASQVTLEGYSDAVGGYLISPKNYAVIKAACELKASVKNATKVEFVVKTSDTDESPIVLEASKESNEGNIYVATLSRETLANIQATGTGVISVVAYQGEGSTVLGTAQFLNLNQDAPLMPNYMFDNFEYYYGNDELLQTKYGEHNSAAGCSMNVTLNAVNKVEGDYGCSFNYKLTFKGSEVWTGGLGRTFNTSDFSKYNAVSMWVKPDGNGQKFVVQLKDSKGKEYEVHLSEFVKGTTAQYVTIPFSSFIVKGGTDSISANDIASCYFWCNSIPGNIADDKKDGDGNYTVEGSIVLDDMRAIKLSNEDLSKLGAGAKYLTSDQPLEDHSNEVEGGNVKPGESSDSGVTVPSETGKSEAEKTDTEKTDTQVSETKTITNSSNKEVQVTTTTTKDANGNVTGSTEKSEIKKADSQTSVVVTVKKDEEGVIQSATSVVTQIEKKDQQMVISDAVLKQMKEAANTSNIKMTIVLKDAEGQNQYRIKVKSEDLVKGKKLKIYRVDTKTGAYEMVNAKTYSMNEQGELLVKMTDKKVYELVSEKNAKAINKKILSSVKVNQSSMTIRAGKTDVVKLHKNLNMKNVKKVTYASTKKSVVNVDKNGTIHANKKGSATILVTVQLKNGDSKVVKTKIKVTKK